MDVLLAIDDTDNETSIGTGELLYNLGQEIEKNNYGIVSRITRHQLFFSELIPYTSHNSAMCFKINTEPHYYNDIINLAKEYLKKNSADGSDPGLCFCDINQLKNMDKLLEFSIRAKTEVVSKTEAISLAEELNIHLSEHGGEGIGVIGALAGVGLRLSGEDGRFKGKLSIGINSDPMTVEVLKSHKEIDAVMTKEHKCLNNNEIVYITERIKTVFLNNKSVLLIKKVLINGEYIYTNLTKEELKKY